MNKLTIILKILLAAILIAQPGCAGASSPEIGAVVPSTTAPAEPSKTPQSLADSEAEAQALLDAGMRFEFTVKADGGTADGGLYTGHGYKSPDGVEISTDRGLYKREKNAKRDCDAVSEEISEILKKERIDSGVRVVAALKQGGFVVTYRSGKVCNVYSSVSLTHLLAFEKWRDG